MMLPLVLPTTLFVVGLIHLVPVAGVFGAVRLEALYGVHITDSTTLLLLQHRAMLFGIIGLSMMVCAFDRSCYFLAAFIGLASMLSYLALWWFAPTLNMALARIALIDSVAVAMLLAGLAAHLFSTRSVV